MAEVFNNKHLGCCESLLNVSRDDILKRLKQCPWEVNKCIGNLETLNDYLKLEYEFIYRFPYKEDLKDEWDTDHEFHDVVISVDPDVVKIPHYDFIQTTIKGQTYNLPFCPENEDSEKMGVVKINHYFVPIRIYGERYTKKNPLGYTLFQCVACEKLFALERGEALYIRKLLNNIGNGYEASLIKYKVTEELSEKVKQLQEYVNSLDNEGLTYSYEDTLKYILSREDEENRDIPIEELKEYLFDCHFCGVSAGDYND